MKIGRFALVCCAAAWFGATAAEASGLDESAAVSVAAEAPPDGNGNGDGIDAIGAALGERTPLAGMQQALASAEAQAGDPSAGGSPSTASLLAPVGLSAVALAFGLLALWRSRRRNEFADTDGLTGLRNRRRLDLDVDDREQLGDRPTAALMIDVDNFKAVNDTYGHSVGDAVLREVGAVISASVRRHDVAYRYGGEEFCVLLPDTDCVVAAAVGERVRLAISNIEPPVPPGPYTVDAMITSARVTASVGVAGGASADLTNTIEDADSALYEAKDAGRNRVVVG